MHGLPKSKGGDDEEAALQCLRSIPSHHSQGRSDARCRERGWHLPRSVAAQSGVGTGRQADQAGAHLRCQRPVRQQRPGRRSRHPPRHRRVQRQGRRAWAHKVEWITADTETNPATGTRVAERFIAQEQCAFLIGAVHSGVANAITQVASKYGTIYLNTNSSAPSEAGENCSRVKFVWDGNGTNFSKASVQNAVEKVGKRWLLLTCVRPRRRSSHRDGALSAIGAQEPSGQVAISRRPRAARRPRPCPASAGPRRSPARSACRGRCPAGRAPS
jgi:hypothetical protein